MSSYENDEKIRDAIAETLEVDIDDHCEATAERWKSKRLGSSAIGYSCSRRVWYSFRWFSDDKIGDAKRPAGRIYRLFARGHSEEIKVNALLSGIGFTFVDPPEGEEQHTFTGFHNHLVTKLDGIVQLPERFNIPDYVMLEVKTANLTGFTKMQKNGICEAEPKYWSQVNFSGALSGLKYVLFVVVSKNDDNIHIEFHKLDEDYGKQLIEKAEHIVTTPAPPLKIAESSVNFACKFCPHVDICHNGQQPLINCRTCQHSSPAVDGQWVCKHPGFNAAETIIPVEVLSKGCPYHEARV